MDLEVRFEGLRGGFHVQFLHESILFDTQNLILRLKMIFMRPILSYEGGSLRRSYGRLRAFNSIRRNLITVFLVAVMWSFKKM